MSLYRVLERQAEPTTNVAFHRTVRRDFPWLEPPPPSRGDVNIFDVRAGTATQWDWAESVWAAWSSRHPTIREWLDAPDPS